MSKKLNCLECKRLNKETIILNKFNHKESYYFCSHYKRIIKDPMTKPEFCKK
jgi:hypothetical protein